MSDVVPYTLTRTAPERTWPALQSSALELANAIAGTEFVPTNLRGNPAAITAAILYGDEVGLGPMQSLAKIAVINGRPTLAAEAQRALILAAGHDLWIEESTTTRCIMAGRRRDSDATSRVTWTMDDAKRAGLSSKQPWRLYPRQMLVARASAELARAVFPDAIGGLAATEELQDESELAQVENGTAAEPAPTRRRRRANVAGAAQPPAPVHSPEPASANEPTAEKSDETFPQSATGGLPPKEQAIVDQLQREFAAVPAVPGNATETPGTPEPPPPITDAQRRKLHALFRERGITDRGERLKWCGDTLGREIPTANDLTLDEATRLIDELAQQQLNLPPRPDEDALHKLDALVAATTEHGAGVITVHDLWVQVAGYRHTLATDLITALGHNPTWPPLRNDLTTAEYHDLLRYLLEQRHDAGLDQ